MKIKLTVFTLLLCAAALLVSARLSSTAAAEQTQTDKFVKFSHKLHTDAGAECASCHGDVAANEKLNEKLTPGHDACQSCHEEQLSSNCQFCHYSDTPEKEAAAPVRDLIINHKQHVDQNVTCVTCHTRIAESEEAGNHAAPTMATCNVCHNKVQAGNECESCHRNMATLYPRSHTRGDFMRDHGRITRLNTYDAKCQSCHEERFCSQCHDGTNLTTLSPTLKVGMISPRTLHNDKAKALAGQMVHDLNYRFTHAIDAKSKRISDCQVCHQSQQFCNDCHNNGAENQGGVLPASHRQPGFALVGGYASGGGRHADLAKRDIEQCAACHDVSGSEPACVRCHMDVDGVKHTNPRTHKSGFMDDTHGEWHSSPGASCYVCHTDANARPNGIKGQGFCGYCHSK
ncbi:MAG: cytochrome c3 family protein [Acidobacteriota bacterium]